MNGAAAAAPQAPEKVTGKLLVRPVTTPLDLDLFLNVPYRVYGADPNWATPLKFEVRELLSAKNPFWARAEKRLFLAERDGRLVGRIAAIENQAHNEFHHDRVGFFGFFECLDDAQASSALLKEAGSWLRSRGLSSMRGPVSPSMGDECGVVIEGFDSPAIILSPYNPPYYAALMDAAGLSKAKDLFGWWLDTNVKDPERVQKIVERAKKRQGLTVRTLNMRRFEAEIELVQEIYNEAWEKNWGFVPMSPDEVGYMAKKLKQVLRPEAVLFAEIGGKAVAMAVTLPDVNEALVGLGGRLGPVNLVKLLYRLPRVKKCRVLALGIRKGYTGTGIDALLYWETLMAGRKLGWTGGEMGWTLEDNDKINAGLAAMGGTVYKKYRIYEKAL